MAGLEIDILGKKYVFFGFSIDVTASIYKQANSAKFQEDFEIWKRWMQDVTKDETIVVCNPYRLANISGPDISGDNKETIIDQKAKVAADALAAELGGNAAKVAAKWIDPIKGMFFCYENNRIYGMQYTGCKLSNTSVQPFKAILFIDFQSLIDKEEKLLLPTILHETTHYLEELTIDNGCFGANGELRNKVDDTRIWGIENPGKLNKDDKWKAIFLEMADYQRNNEEERMTTLIEKMAIGSLYEDGDRSWVEVLKASFYNALKERRKIY